MKKHKLLLALAVSGLVLGACGTEETTSENETEQTGAATEVETTDTAADTSEAVEETAEVSDTVYEGMNGTYEIVETEQLQNAMFPEKQIMAITINYTNTTEEPQNPWFAWASDVEATQETEATVETLMGANGQYPADYKPEAVAMGDTDIKPGATVEAVIGHEILYPGEPIFLKDMNMLGTSGELFYREIPTQAAE